jgi:hypothetical protein
LVFGVYYSVKRGGRGRESEERAEAAGKIDGKRMTCLSRQVKTVGVRQKIEGKDRGRGRKEAGEIDGKARLACLSRLVFGVKSRRKSSFRTRNLSTYT